MKKLASFLLVLAMILSMGTLAFADGTTTLSTTVPAAQYTLNIPADQTIPFGATSAGIGNVTVSDSSGFAVGKNIKVTVTYDAFSSSDVSTTIPFELVLGGAAQISGTSVSETKKFASGEDLVFRGLSSGSVESKAFMLHYYSNSSPVQEYDIYVGQLKISMLSTDWGKALGGDYTAQITFTSEVVVAE